MKKIILVLFLFLTFNVFSQKNIEVKIHAGLAQMGVNEKNAEKMGIYKSNAISPLIGIGLEYHKSKLNYGINANYINASFDRTSSPVNKSVNLNFHTFRLNPYFSVNATKKSSFSLGLFSSLNIEDTRKKIVFEKFELQSAATYAFLKSQVLRNSPIGVSMGYQVQVQNRLCFKIERYQSLFVPKESGLLITPFAKSFFSSWQLSTSFSIKK